MALLWINQVPGMDVVVGLCLRHSNSVDEPYGKHTTLSFATTFSPMKFSAFFAVSLAFVASTHAQYFSDGWLPGQETTEQVPPPEFTPGVTPGSSEGIPVAQESFSWSSLSLTKVLESSPVSSLFNKFGVNISQQLELAKARADVWDSRIPLITDDNYEDIIVNEELTPEEEEKRVWFVVMCVQLLLPTIYQ